MDLDAAYQRYLRRFEEKFGNRHEGSFVKFGRHLVQKLDRPNFDARYRSYLEVHAACKHMLASGSTINEAVAMALEETAAWVAIETPDLLTMFRGELGEADAPTESRESRRPS